MNNAQRLAELLIKAATQFAKLNARQQEFAIKEINRVRLELQDLLLDYSNKDNKITFTRLGSLLRDLDTIERMVRETGMQALIQVIEEAGEHGQIASEAALKSVLGTSATAYFSKDAFNRISADVVRYVTTRFGEDGLVLSDRIWRLAHEQRVEIENVIRSGIILGQSVNTMVSKIRKVYDTETWKIRRLVVTEGNVAYRTASAYVAQRSNVVKGLRIHRGKANNPRHRCTQLEQEDRYGLGKGVYLPTDSEVLNPHPNCTSYVTYELVDLTEVKARAN